MLKCIVSKKKNSLKFYIVQISQIASLQSHIKTQMTTKKTLQQILFISFRKKSFM